MIHIHDIDPPFLADIVSVANAFLESDGEAEGARVRYVDGVWDIEIDLADGSMLSIAYVDDLPKLDTDKARKMTAIVEKALQRAVDDAKMLRSANTHKQAIEARSIVIRHREQVEVGLQAVERLREFIETVDQRETIPAPSDNAAACYAIVWPNTD